MSIAFPVSPTNGQVATIGSTDWVFNGVSWHRFEGAVRPFKTVVGQSLLGTGDVTFPAASLTEGHVSALLDRKDRVVTAPFTFSPNTTFRLKLVCPGAASVQMFGIDHLGEETLMTTMNVAVAGTEYFSHFADNYESVRLVIVSGSPVITYLN